MEQPPRRSAVDDILGDSDLMTLVELQKFLADELADGTEGAKDFSRAFLPLTDGLGLESPPVTEVPKAPIVASPRPQVQTPTYPQSQPQFPHAESAGDARYANRTLGALEDFDTVELETRRPERVTENRSLANVLDRRESPAPSRPAPRPLPMFGDEDLDIDKAEAAAVPPPVPKVTFSRRLLSGLIDEIFVLSLWLLSIAITSNILSGSQADLMARLPKDFANPVFQRFVALEFAAIWLGYLAICSAMDMTFGMWVWGLRVGYGEESSRLGRFFARATRVFFSFVFYAPILPAVILVVRAKGRNLLDWVSGTRLYRTGI